MNANLKFRPAMPSDVAAITHLVRAAYAKWVPVIGREPLPVTVDYRHAVDQNDFALLYDRDELVGLIETINRPDALWIENIAVAPEHQGKGLGLLLLNHAEALAGKQGHRVVQLLTNAAFRSNVLLYKKAGYAITDAEPFINGVTVHMAKQLPQPERQNPSAPPE